MDYLIIGAGPAGLQLGYLLAKAGRDFQILEAGSSAGTFFKTFPRHRTLISSNKVYNGTSDAELNLRMDWNSLLSDDPELLFTRYSDRYFPPADVIVKYFSDFAEKNRLPIQYDARVTWLQKLITPKKVRDLVPEAADLEIEVYVLPNLGAVNVLIRGLLGDGVAASTRFDPQAKGLGEWVRSRMVSIEEGLL